MLMILLVTGCLRVDVRLTLANFHGLTIPKKCHTQNQKKRRVDLNRSCWADLRTGLLVFYLFVFAEKGHSGVADHTGDHLYSRKLNTAAGIKNTSRTPPMGAKRLQFNRNLNVAVYCCYDCRFSNCSSSPTANKSMQHVSGFQPPADSRVKSIV